MDDTRKPDPKFDKDKIQWPLTYSLKPPKTGDPPRQYWHYSYYRGPRNSPAQILYSDSLSRSESLARIFLNEPVLGFDMEWKYPGKSTRLQEKVSLIQIACERRIALFHVALHEGQTTDEIIAPSLRRIIESPSIIKTGVHIVGADFKRLKKYLHLQPKGAFELSHLHHLVCGEPHKTQLCALAKQVEYHLGLPLDKGKVRKSDWSLPLSEGQRIYAADDSYVGFMLFHCMNAKRLKMDPVPPLPQLADSPKISSIELESTAAKTQSAVTTVKPFVDPQPVESNTGLDAGNKEVEAPQEKENNPVKEKAETAHSHTVLKPSEPYMSSKLFIKLKSHRTRIAHDQNIPAYRVAPNTVLEELVKQRPVNKSQLLKIYGIGRRKADEFGDEWLQIIAEDLRENPPKATRNPLQPTDPNRGTATPDALKHSIFGDENFNQKRVKITNVRRSKEIHIYQPSQGTGLSFSLADSHLNDVEATAEKG
ncbi:ribonuclease H-like domain-containing protein [Hypoxylon rubiginosum]|uniref:Ribonuclease H-like domain-containing protein n=1 Tax=Hypoxylon rubiginosum TaxID=110542 RepID=A0ACC0CN28_9PEZI|nr:ribonuclease H-like domain-containing protein [Hypoxylon rubiginosum]